MLEDISPSSEIKHALQRTSQDLAQRRQSNQPIGHWNPYREFVFGFCNHATMVLHPPRHFI